MHKVKKVLAICLTTVMSLVLLGTVPTQVYAADYLNNSTTKSQLFAVPEGGWSSITTKVDYNEYYVTVGSNNNFTNRIAMSVYTVAGATSIPYVTLGNVKHSNDKTFSSWNNISIIYDGSKWNGGFGKKNTDSVTYSTTTSVTGKLAFLVSCNGAIPATSAGSVDLALKTK